MSHRHQVHRPAFRPLLLLPAAALLLLLSPGAGRAQLSGSYTIGSGGDYATFGAAVTALVSSGVSGPVTFNVISGTYNEQISIGAVTGTSTTNTVTFRSQSGTAADVVLSFVPTSANNYVVRFDGCDHVIFRDMTVTSAGGSSYGIVFSIIGDADGNGIHDNVISGVPTTGGSTNLYLVHGPNGSADDVRITGNSFTDGSWGVVLYGVNTSTLSTGLEILDNTFTNQGNGGVFLQSQLGVKIHRNVVTGASMVRGIDLQYCDGALEVQRNRVSIGSSYGIYLYFCDGGTGIPTPRGNVSNNMVQVGGGSTAYGIYVYYSTSQDVYFNSVNITSPHTTAGQAINVSGVVSSINIVNNVLANPGGGYAYVVEGGATAAVTTSDYNDLYTTGSYVGYWGSTPYATLAELQSASSKDAASISVYPSFASSTDLHTTSPWLDGAGTAVSPSITIDYDGDARSAPHDIGADAFTAAPSTTTPLSGTYTIGSGGDYASFAAAIADLLLKGVSAAVTFDVLPATYNERLSLLPVPGASATNTVTFQSQSGTASDVILFYIAAGASDNSVIHLNGADYIRFLNLTLASNTAPNSTYANVVTLVGGADGFRMEGCSINGTPTGGGSTNQYLVYGDNSVWTSRVITGNSFTDGSYGVVMYGLNTSTLSSGTQVTSNTFANHGTGGVFLQSQVGARVNGNTVSGSSLTRGIELQYCDGALQVQKNKLSVASTYGLYLYFCDGGTGLPTPRGNVSNNMVQVGGGSTAYGIYVYYSTYQDVYFNSVNITSPHSTAGQAINASGVITSVNIVNNVLANSGGGYSYVVEGGATSGINTSDYNDLYSTGSYVGYWNATPHAALADLRSASGKDAASVSVYPSFTSSTDLHTNSPWLDGKGTAVSPSVSTDFDGDARSAPHDIGADAFTASPSTTTPLSGAYTIGSGGDYATFGAAVADLLLKGVSAPVTFNVFSEIFTERVVLLPVPGATSSNTVTFQSESGTASDATLFYSASGPSDNAVIHVNGADYIRVRNLTLAANTAPNSAYATVVTLVGGAEGFRMEGNIVVGTPTTGGSTNQYLVYGDNAFWTSRVITGNSFTDGSYGVVMYGLNTSTLSTGTQVTSNTFTNHGTGGVFLQSQLAARVNGNTISGPSMTRGIELQYCDGGLQVQKNKISTGSTYGIYLYFCDGGTGLPTPRGNVSNNMVHIGGGSTAYGIYLYYPTYQDVYFNSVNITSTHATAGQAINVSGTATSINIVNNVLANSGGGYAYVVEAAATTGINTSDYNDLYSTGSYLASWSGTPQPMLADLQSAGSKDAASVSVYPSFTSSTDLHTASPWLDGRGTTVSPSVSTDYDGDARSVPHDIGADAFTAAPSTTTPLSGTLTIGSGAAADGSGAADYASFALALADLLLKGVSAPVTFEVMPGTYNEQISIPPVPGASPSNTVTFGSQSGDPASAILSFTSATAANNYVVRFEGADHVRLQNLTISSNNTPNTTYAIVVHFTGGSDNNRLDGNHIIGTPTTGGSGNQYLVYADNTFWTSRTINNNTLTDGSWGVVMYGINTSTLSSGTVITGNTFANQGNGGVFLQSQQAPRVNGNTGSGSSTVRGIELQYCDGGLEVIGNKFSVAATYGIYLYFCDGGTGSPTPRGLTANNMIQVGGTSTAYGIGLYYTTYQDVYHNSVNITSSHATAGQALNVSGSVTSVNIVNNAFANSGAGYAYVVESAATGGIGTSDHNAMHASGTNVAYWSTTAHTSLGSLQSASGKDAMSLGVNPTFYSATNLRPLNPDLDSAGTPLASVTADFDGEPRDPSAPDIGADEFSLIVTFEPQLLTGWNMIGLTLAVADPRKTALYPEAISNAFAYRPPPVGYTAKDTILNGTGYWLKFPAAADVSVTGVPVLRDTIDLTLGWNLIGSIAYPIAKTAVVQSAGGLVASNYFAFNGASGYGASDTLRPGRAYWVKASAPGTIVLDVKNTSRTVPVAPGEPELPAPPPGDAVTFASVRIPGQAATLTLVDDRVMQESRGLFELPPPPPAGAFDVRFASNRSGEARPAPGVELPVLLQGLTGPVRVSFAPAAGGPLSLVERDAAGRTTVHTLAGGHDVLLSDVDGKRFALAGTETPREFALEQNYPNPFNPSTTIRFALPADGIVSLVVYNVLGEIVATPVSRGAMPAGYHAVEFDAAGLPTGAYLYSLRVETADGGSFARQKKMLLMK